MVSNIMNRNRAPSKGNKWWRENPDKADPILARRALRYKTDESYREKIKKGVRERRSKLIFQRSRLGTTYVRVYHSQRRVALIDGEWTLLAGLSEVASLLGNNSKEKSGFIEGEDPKPVIKGSCGRMWFDLSAVKRSNGLIGGVDGNKEKRCISGQRRFEDRSDEAEDPASSQGDREER